MSSKTTNLRQLTQARGGIYLGPSSTKSLHPKLVWRCGGGHTWEARAHTLRSRGTCRRSRRNITTWGIQQLALYSNLRNFIDLCGQLRFQTRWSHIHRIPKTSVLGHMLVVALLFYLFFQEIKACPKRYHNNFFTRLFHGLPEVLTVTSSRWSSGRSRGCLF